MASRVSFYAEPGTRLSAYLPPDAREVSWVFGESGTLSFDADDQEPISAIREHFSDVVSETKPKTEPKGKAE